MYLDLLSIGLTQSIQHKAALYNPAIPTDTADFSPTKAAPPSRLNYGNSHSSIGTKDEAMANGNLSIRGVARCCSVHRSAILRSGEIVPQKLAQTLMAHGFQGGELAKDGFNAQATWLTQGCGDFNSQNLAQSLIAHGFQAGDLVAIK